MARALAAALAVTLLVAVPSAGGSGAQTPRMGGTLELELGNEPQRIAAGGGAVWASVQAPEQAGG